MNEGFLPFKNTHVGDSAILFASGPTLEDFTYGCLPEPPVVRVGVNSVIHRADITLDYFFCAHDSRKDPTHHRTHPNHSEGAGLPDYVSAAGARKDLKHIFVGTEFNGAAHPQYFTEEEAAAVGATTYGVSNDVGVDAFRWDICSFPLFNHSIVFPALQFLLFTGVVRIYLVGNDCSGGHSFLFPELSSPYDAGTDDIMPHWRDFAGFVKGVRPAVEIVSINPRSLEGMFTDIWTT